MFSVRWCVVLALLLYGVAAVRGPPAHAAGPSGEAKFTTRYPIVLGLDLRDDTQPKAKLIINQGWASSPSDINVALPFRVSDQSDNERAAVRIGNYDSWTMVSFWGGGTSWPQEISFRPEVGRAASADDIEDSPNGLTIVAAGQERRFYYRYASASFLARPTDATPSGLSLRSTDAVAIELPQGATEFAVRRGQLSVPARIAADELAFPGLPPSPDVKFIEIAYQVPPTDLQKTVVKWGVKFLAAILPLVALAFLDREQIARPRWRWVLVGVGVLLFCAALSIILWSAARAKNADEVYYDLLLLVTGTVVTASLAFVKVKAKSPARTGP